MLPIIVLESGSVLSIIRETKRDMWVPFCSAGKLTYMRTLATEG